MAEDFSDGTSGIRKGEELDASAVGKYILSAIPGLKGELKIEQFPSGHSNLTYFISAGGRGCVRNFGKGFIPPQAHFRF